MELTKEELKKKITLKSMRDEMRAYASKFEWTKEGRDVLNRAIKGLPPMYLRGGSVPSSWHHYNDMAGDMHMQVVILADIYKATRI